MLAQVAQGQQEGLVGTSDLRGPWEEPPEGRVAEQVPPD